MSDRVMPQALEPREGRRLQSHREVYEFSRVRSSCHFYSGRVDTQPLTRVLFVIVFLQILHDDWVEADRVLTVVYILTECRETIGFVCSPSITLGIDDVPCVTVVTMIATVAS